MPGTTRYSATFDRTYEEEAKPSSPPNARRSRSQSWQANSGHDGRQYTPFASRSPAPRSSSTDNNPGNGTEFIPTRTAKTSVKAHNNPFQFVKVGTCPLYKKAEEQLKKAKETKKPDVLKEEEEEWQTNLDSWKSRRRKMSEDVFRRQEELKLLELEEQIAQVSNKKTKTFSEMVESRATRGRALSLCLLTSPLEFQNWEFENKSHKSGSCSYTDESGENSIVNSEDEGVSVRGRHEENSINESTMNHRTNGDAHIEQNGTALDKQNGNCNKLSNSVQMKTKENSYIDSGLESISSSHRAGDTPDSGSDFSQDSNSSIDCDSPRTGVNVLKEFSSKSSQLSEGHEIRIILKLDEKGQDFGFTFLGGKDEGQVIIASILEGSKAESSGLHLGDRIIMIDGCDVSSKKHIEIAALIQKGREKNQMSLLLWRHTKTTNGTNGFIAEAKHNKVDTDENFNAKSHEKSIESENEMFVDDFEELKRQSELLANKKSVAANAQSTNSQKVNTPAKLNEESKISNDTLNVVFQSQSQNMGLENITNNNFENNSNRMAISTDLVNDVPPVDKIAEEMEKLILEQLEEEERAKELSNGKVLVESSPEHFLTAPPRLVEPPKEKPPPPPSTESPKDSSLKRVNSTKRIKKEIHKRRSNFLGIENADESIICSESSVPPPPALEEILKAEMELDRQTRLRIENEATERLTLEEKEIMQKEREIIESLESEERRKIYLNGTEECNSVYMSNSTSDTVCEQNHIESLKSERKRIDTELQLSEEQQQILLEEKQLKEREEFIRQQEAAISTAPLSDSSFSVSANTANNLKKPALSSVPTEVQSNGLLLGTNGDGSVLALSSSTEVSMNETSKGGIKIKASEKPAVPPKPLKKKEAIRKERERLRQEQEALQREREEHRRKLLLEQEELIKQQKTHAPEAPAPRLGPHPPQIQPSFPPQLTTIMNATPNARENASFPSRSHHGTSNTAAGSLNTVELMGPPVVRQNVRPAPRKAAQNEAWGQQKMPSVRKQNHESLPESRYNQNHWLIQEAEMRRIAELKERQRAPQPPCTQTHLAEDDVCSNPPRVPVISPSHNPHLNYPVQEKVWNYGQSNMPLKKYPPPVVKEPPLHTIYPRETVPQQPPTKPSRSVPSDRQEQMLSVSGRKRCSHCNEELGRGAAMIIESLQLYYHIHCFQCCVCQAQLGNGSCGTDVRVRNNKLHCHNCYSNDEAGLKFSQV